MNTTFDDRVLKIILKDVRAKIFHSIDFFEIFTAVR